MSKLAYHYEAFYQTIEILTKIFPNFLTSYYKPRP
nr:MAG TPA: hypothetical protein [Inoviridae sp.]